VSDGNHNTKIKIQFKIDNQLVATAKTMATGKFRWGHNHTVKKVSELELTNEIKKKKGFS